MKGKICNHDLIINLTLALNYGVLLKCQTQILPDADSRPLIFSETMYCSLIVNFNPPSHFSEGYFPPAAFPSECLMWSKYLNMN